MRWQTAIHMLAGLTLFAATAAAASGDSAVTISDVSVKGRIEGENITFDLAFAATIKGKKKSLDLVSGDMVLMNVAKPFSGYELRYAAADKTYSMYWPRSGAYEVETTFAARPKMLEDGTWREAEFTVPASNMRQLEVICDRTDLEVRFPGALRLSRELRDDTLVITAILGPGRPFVVRWKPQVAEMAAKLVFASEANTIATASAGTIRLDTVFAFEITQGKLTNLEFSVPKTLSVTQVRGPHIRDWRIETSEGEDSQSLAIILSRPQESEYGLQVLSEMVVDSFPAEVGVATIEPKGCIRAGGFLAVGTNSAIHLQVRQLTGLSQIDVSAFPRIALDREHTRLLPATKAFYYMYAATPSRLTLTLDDIVPSYDVVERIVLHAKEDELVMDVKFELDVRDAPIRSLAVQIPKEFAVADVSGAVIEDHTVGPAPAGPDIQTVQIQFSKPVLGRTLIDMRLELGRSPLSEPTRIANLTVPNAKTERGYLALVADQGIQIEKVDTTDLREVHTGSGPMPVANAQFAYRFREQGWTLELLVKAKPAAVRGEIFHLVSLGHGVLYGSITANYFISGAPIDELHFGIPDGLEHVEFVGSDVSRWSREGDIRTVKLQSKVIGDYNLGISYTRSYKEGETLTVGGVRCEKVDTQTGYVAIASHLDLNLAEPEPAGRQMIAIDRGEIPANYRLLINAPLLKSYKFVQPPNGVDLTVTSFERGSLLPVVIEVMELNTHVNVRKDGETESITRVRYKVKNSSQQFLALTMPPDAVPWATCIVEKTSANRERKREVSARQDKGFLMIPLPRYRNPNDPITVELEYGQVHENLGKTGALPLVAPVPAVRSAFGNWTVNVPPKWSVFPGDDGSMAPKERALPDTGLASLAEAAATCWLWSVQRTWWKLRGLPAVFLILAVAGALILAKLIRGRLWRALAVVLLTAALLILGIVALAGPEFRRIAEIGNVAGTLTFTQPLNLSEAPLRVATVITPAWRGGADYILTAVFAGVAVLCLAAGIVFRRLRGACLALTGTALICGAAAFPGAYRTLLYVLTLGLPILLALRCAAQSACRRRMRRVSATPAAAVICAGLFLLLLQAQPLRADEVQAPPPPVPPPTEPAAPVRVLERVACLLSAEDDCMSIKLKLSFAAAGPLEIPLLDKSAILLSDRRIGKYVRVRQAETSYVLQVDRKGKYTVDIAFLSPLETTADDQQHRFQMPMPLALSNSVELTVPTTGMRIEAPTAIHFTSSETPESSSAVAVFGPGEGAAFTWEPRVRQVELEATVFFSDIISLARFDSGLVECRHHLRFQIAQGELRDITIRVPDAMTVTALNGTDVGAWRFNPASKELEVRLARGVSGEYRLGLVTQMSSAGTPYSVAITSLDVRDATRQRGIIGVAVSPAVHIAVQEHPQTMNLDDFARDAAAVMAEFGCVDAKSVRHAYRYHAKDEVLTVEVHEVLPEIRTREHSTFSVADDRLIYNGDIAVEITKAGVFSFFLTVPEGYDIDTLTSAAVSHWDDADAPDDAAGRRIQVHLLSRQTGEISLKVALSRSVSELPELVLVPRIAAQDTLKHTGQILITADRGVRLSVSERTGVSEVNPAEADIRTASALAFKLLDPQWHLALRTEVLQPRIVADVLHVASVTDGLVRHAHHLRFRLHNAGAKLFGVQVPENVLGLLIEGPDIAHMEENPERPGEWRIELAEKWFERPYPLQLSYETQFSRDTGEVQVRSVKAVGVDLQRGYLAVKTTDRVALSVKSPDPDLQPAEARNIRGFGSRELSDAAFCYRSAAANYDIMFIAARHDAAELLEAEVLQTAIDSVITDQGESINRVSLKLRVGDKRHLEVRLPSGADIWSLQVNRRSTVPSLEQGDAVLQTVLVPLAAEAHSDLPVDVEFIYVVHAPPKLELANQNYAGPQFDLPLKGISWTLYLPENVVYDDFEGSLTVVEESLRDQAVKQYDIRAYETTVQMLNARDVKRAEELQNRAELLEENGRQYAAKQMLNTALLYSQSDSDLNEDARVQLHQLNRKQAVVGLVGRRGHLRQQSKAVGQQPAAQQAAAPAMDLGDRFSRDEAERLENSLSTADSANLELITDRMIEMQEAAAGATVQLMINMPLRGRRVEYTRPLQVKPNTPMEVSFVGKTAAMLDLKENSTWALKLFIALLVCFGIRPSRISHGAAPDREASERTHPGTDGQPDAAESATVGSVTPRADADAAETDAAAEPAAEKPDTAAKSIPEPAAEAGTVEETPSSPPDAAEVAAPPPVPEETSAEKAEETDTPKAGRKRSPRKQKEQDSDA